MKWIGTAGLVVLFACNGKGPAEPDPVDVDLDGYPSSEDCDDSNAEIHPGAEEVCDGIDNDCDTEVDESAVDGLTFYQDSDGDMYGDPSASLLACAAPEGYVTDSTDCDDSSSGVYPGAAEVCDDLDSDENCDGLAENDAPDNDPATQTTYYVDEDQDTYGDENDAGTLYCDDPSTDAARWSTNNTDCNDADDTVYPGAAEVFDYQDNDCDGLGDNASLADANAKLLGERSNDQIGTTVSSAGDVNGDGFSDVLIGAHRNGTADEGAAYIVLGSSSGISDLSLSSADAKLIGVISNRMGRSVSAADINGDKFSDVLIGSDWGIDGTIREGAGVVYIVLGSNAGISDTKMFAGSPKLYGEKMDDNASQVSGAGDVNGDGYEDVLIGAIGDDNGGTNAGAAYIAMGASDGFSTMSLSEAEVKLTGESAYNEAGGSVSGAGDVNGDGFADVLIGAENADSSAGAVYLLLGAKSGLKDMSLSGVDAKLSGESSSRWAGRSVSSAGDVNGDGYADVLIGAPGDGETASRAGAAYIVLGSASGILSMDLSKADGKLTGDKANTYAGSSVSSAGDVNKDGYSDVLIGAVEDDTVGTEAGAAHIVLGSSSGIADGSLSESDVTLTGEGAYHEAGASVSSAGDVDGDGYADVLIGAPNAGERQVGTVYLMYGF